MIKSKYVHEIELQKDEEIKKLKRKIKKRDEKQEKNLK